MAYMAYVTNNVLLSVPEQSRAIIKGGANQLFSPFAVLLACPTGRAVQKQEAD